MIPEPSSGARFLRFQKIAGRPPFLPLVPSRLARPSPSSPLVSKHDCLPNLYGLEEDEEVVLVDNKCQCIKVTSKSVPSKDNPPEEVLERTIRIMVPLTTRENISDPTSPLRTRFVYNLSKLCDNCESKKTNQEQGLQQDRNGQSSRCNDPDQPCYTYDRNKCYTATCLFSNGGKLEPIETALTPESCYPD